MPENSPSGGGWFSSSVWSLARRIQTRWDRESRASADSSRCDSRGSARGGNTDRRPLKPATAAKTGSPCQIWEPFTLDLCISPRVNCNSGKNRHENEINFSGRVSPPSVPSQKPRLPPVGLTLPNAPLPRSRHGRGQTRRRPQGVTAPRRPSPAHCACGEVRGPARQKQGCRPAPAPPRPTGAGVSATAAARPAAPALGAVCAPHAIRPPLSS